MNPLRRAWRWLTGPPICDHSATITDFSGDHLLVRGQTRCARCGETITVLSAEAAARIRKELLTRLTHLDPSKDAARHARIDELSPGWREAYERDYGHKPGTGR